MSKSFITLAIEYRIKQEVEYLVQVAQDELQKKIPEIIAGVALEIQEKVSAETMGNTITFRIDSR